MKAAASPEDFGAMLARAGISQEKPLYRVLMTIHETAHTAREAVNGGARGLSPAGEKELIQRIADHSADATHKEIERLALRVGWRNAVLMALAGLGLLGCGYVWGHWQRAEPGFLGQLERLNDAGAIERYCRAHAVQQGGGTACDLGMVWIARSRTGPD